MLKLFILLFLLSCTKEPDLPSQNSNSLNFELDPITFSITNNGVINSLTNNMINLPSLLKDEVANINISLINTTNQNKSISIENISSNINLSSNCATIKPKRKCSIKISNKKVTAGTYQETFKINGIDYFFNFSINNPISVNSSLVFDNEISLDNSAYFYIRNLSSKTQALSLNYSDLEADVLIESNSCSNSIRPKRYCLLKLVRKNNAIGGVKLLYVNNNSVAINVQSSNNCLNSGRISSQECDQISISSSMVKQVINVSQYPEAVCNDGSPAVFYFRPGSGSGVNRWIIHLEEGGFCGRIPIYLGNFYLGEFNNCTDRVNTTPYYVSTTLTGAEAYYPYAYNYNEGILSKDYNKNPDFYTWNHVEIRYCSSDLWSGNSQQSVNSQLFKFKGTKIIDAVFTELTTNFGLNVATNVILTGSSAGGIGIINQGDRIKDTFLAQKDVVILSDSGFLFNYPNPSNAYIFSKLFELNHTYLNGSPDVSCVQRAGNPQLCYFGAVNKNDIVADKFFIQDQLDDFYLNVINQVDLCSSSFSDAWINGYTQELRNSVINENVVSLRTKKHVFLNNSFWRQPIIEETYSVSEIFSNWYFNRNGIKKYIQSDVGNIRIELESLCN